MKKYKKQIYLFLFVSLLIVIGSFAFLFINFKKQVKLQGEILKIEKKVILADSLSNNLLQVESDKRGLQLTNDVNYLNFFNTLKTNINDNITSLKRDIVADEYKGIVFQIDSLLKLRMINLDSGVLVFNHSGRDAAVGYMQLKDKKDVRNLLDQKLMLLKNNLQLLLSEHAAAINKRSTQNVTDLIILLLIFILLMFFAAYTFRKSQQKIIKNHVKFKEAQRIAKIGSWEWDIATNKLIWSQEQFRLFGENRKTFDLTYNGYLSHLSEKDRDTTDALLKNVLAGKTNFAIEHEIIRKDGTTLMVFEQGTVLYDEKNRPTGMFGTTQDITERKKADEKIKAERKLLHTLIDNIPDLIYLKDDQGRKIMANKADMDFMGVKSEEEFMTKTDLELFPSENGAEGYKNDLDVINTGQPIINKEEEFTDVNGQKRWLLTTKIPLHNSENMFAGLLGIGRDITRFKNSESEMIEAQKKFRAIFDNTADGIYQSTVDGKFIMANPALARIFDYNTPEELISSITDIGAQIYADAGDRKIMSDLLSKYDHIENFEVPLLTKNNEIVWVSESTRVVRDENGNIKYFEGTLKDITERKRAEQELSLVQERYRAIFDHTADGIYQSTVDGKFIMVNPSMARIFGYDSPNEMISSITDISTQVYADPVERKKMTEIILVEGNVQNYELQVLTKNKDMIWVSANIRIVRDEKGDINYFEGTLEDITERKKAEAEILQLNRNLDQFANITAHDLQEPIRMVSGFLGLLHKKYNDLIDEQGKSYIYRAKDGADRMSILIKDLLEFSRSGNKAAKKEFVDLRYVMDLVDKDLSIVMADTGAALRIPPSLPEVIGNQSALYRLFLNLISNGIKFRKKDTTPEINITEKELNDCWEFTVQDNGIGVAEKDQPKLFQAFQRLHRREEYPGTGLGLVTCKKIVEMHGGKIWMTSKEGKGTTFHFTILKCNN